MAKESKDSKTIPIYSDPESYSKFILELKLKDAPTISELLIGYRCLSDDYHSLSNNINEYKKGYWLDIIFSACGIFLGIFLGAYLADMKNSNYLILGIIPLIFFIIIICIKIIKTNNLGIKRLR